MWDCDFPWCFLANSAFASPFPKPEGFICEGSALFNADAIVWIVYLKDMEEVGFVEKAEIGSR
jgi:hypothetical protein